MTDLNLFDRTFPVSEEPGLKTIDPRFQELATLAQNGQFGDLKGEVEALIGEDILDIRMLGYYMYAVFDEEGLPALTEIFCALNSLLESNWEAIGPARKKEKQTDTIIQWFLAKVIKVVEHHQGKDDGDWQTWVSQYDSTQTQIAIDNLQAFEKTFLTLIEESQSADTLRKMQGVFQQLHNLVVARERQQQQKQEQQELDAQQQEQEQQEQEQKKQARDLGQAAQMSMDVPVVQGSMYMQELVDKLRAFETLIENGKVSKAALVADDINQILENFDPRIYFPSLFSNYFSLLSSNIEEIAGHWEMKDMYPWMFQHQLYKVDLQRFVEED